MSAEPQIVSDSGWCHRCHTYKLIAKSCHCQPFGCAIPWNKQVSEDDWQQVWAVDAEAAAEKYAEELDSDGDYTIMKNHEGEVWTRGADAVIQKWHIRAEAVPTYSASALG